MASSLAPRFLAGFAQPPHRSTSPKTHPGRCPSQAFVSTISATYSSKRSGPRRTKNSATPRWSLLPIFSIVAGSSVINSRKRYRPYLCAKPSHRLPGAIELRSQEDSPLALRGFFREATRSLG